MEQVMPGARESRPSAGAVQDLVHGWVSGLVDEPAEEVFLQGLPGGCRSTTQNRVHVVGDALESSTSRKCRGVKGRRCASSDRGVHTLKGVPDEWQLYAVQT